MAGHGGRRKGAGGPRHYPPLKKRCVTLTDAQCKLLRMYGKGSLSVGLRWLIDSTAPAIKRPEGR